MKVWMPIALLLTAGCARGTIGGGSADDVDRILFSTLELSGTSATPRTVTAGERDDGDGAADRGFRFAWSLADCAGCLPPDTGDAQTHVFRIRAEGGGEITYKKVTVTLSPASVAPGP